MIIRKKAYQSENTCVTFAEPFVQMNLMKYISQEK
jgi:hypothetical protein